jgi:hypothetical protein
MTSVRHDQGTITTTTKVFFVMVVAAIAALGLPLYLVPGKAGSYWAWTVAEPRTAMLIGSVYFVPIFHYSLLLAEREWLKVQTTLRSLFLIAVWLTVVAMFHWGNFYPWRPLTLVWLYGYYLPLFAIPIIFRLQAGRFGKAEDAGGQRIGSGWRRWLQLRAAVYTAVAIALLFATSTIASWWPWPIEPVNLRMFSGQVALFGAMPGYVILDGSWRRMQLFMRLVALMAIGHLVLLNLPLGTPYDWTRPLAWSLMLMPIEWLATAVGMWLAHRGESQNA